MFTRQQRKTDIEVREWSHLSI